MCITSNLQRHIRNLTGDGEVVARFLVNTVEGKTPGVKPCHQMEASKHLIRFGFTDEEQSHFWGLLPTPEELAAAPSRHSRENGNPAGQGGAAEKPPLPQGEGWGEGENASKPVTHLDILNYDIAHLIRQETADGHTIAEFLSDVMTRRDKPYTPKKLRIRHTDRMAAAREILRRGFGHFGRRRKIVIDDLDDTNDYDTLHTDLAKRMREYSEHGTDAVRFLLDVMEDANPDENSPLSLREKVRVKSPESSLSKNSKTQTDPKENPLSLRERARVRVKSPESSPTKDNTSSPSCTSLSIPDDDRPDCYYKPLDPDDEAAFNYQTLIEFGEFKEGEITIHQPTPEDWKAFKGALRHITELAASEGVPLLPNPLAGKLRAPTLRSP